jgi:DNA repair protein RecN (Recombination protein N)
MKQMSANLQVISITHLPQVAAKGDCHFKVFKTETASTTNTQIKLLSNEERVNELAKMLSGEQITQAAVSNAMELLKN